VSCILIQPSKSAVSKEFQARGRYPYVLNKDGMTYPDASTAFSYAMNFAWDWIRKQEDGIVSVIDSDMFFIEKFNFERVMINHDFAFVPQYRQVEPSGLEASVFYPWTGFMIFNLKTLPEPAAINWSCGTVNGHQVDPGGLAHAYLIEKKPRLKFLEFYTINTVERTEPDGYQLGCSKNGNSNFYITFDHIESWGRILDMRVMEPTPHDGHKFFPYEKGSKNYVAVLARQCILLFEDYLLDYHTYPQPTNIDFIGAYDKHACARVTPFILHYKGGSNYSGFDYNYHLAKTQFIMRLLVSVSGGKIRSQVVMRNEEILYSGFFYKLKNPLRRYLQYRFTALDRLCEWLRHQ